MIKMEDNFKLIIITIILSLLLIFGLCVTSSYAQFGLAMPPCNMKSITGTLSVTSGSTTQLTDATINGYWNSNSTTVATINSVGLVTGVATGTSTISYSLSNYCLTTSVVTITTLTIAYDPTHIGSGATLSGSNFILTGSSGGGCAIAFSSSSGKTYTEFTVNSLITNTAEFGIINTSSNPTDLNSGSFIGSTSAGWGWGWVSGAHYKDHGGRTFTTYGDASLNVGDVIGLAIDLTNGFLYISRNGTFMNSSVPTSGASGTGAIFGSLSGTFWFATSCWNTNGITKNSIATYSPPTGYTFK